MSDESTAWDALRLLRMHGKRPTLPVIVTSNRLLPERLRGVGCLVIHHVAGEVLPVKLLDGLDVIFILETCELVNRVYRMASLKGVKFERLRAWCRCAQALNVTAYDCNSYAAAVDWAQGTTDAAA